MDEKISVDLQSELIADLTLELQKEDGFDSEILTQKVINAIREVRQERRYPSYYTDERIKKDLYSYYSTIRKIALYDYNLVGAEGQSAHSENGTSRTYFERAKQFVGVIPIARV